MESLLEALKKGRINEGQTINDNGYFDTYKDNIFGGKMETRFQKMFDEGSGGELHSKAEAVHSSSMLSYNFFHWIDENHTFTWENIEYNQVLFEVKMKTIKGSNAPACMDVVLIDKKKENLLFIESKFTEYTEAKKFKLSESYRDSNKWFYDKEKIDWNEIINYATEASKEKNYNEGIKQIITHLFGIHNLLYVKGHNIKVNLPGIIDTVIGTVGAIIFPMENITEFLYFIGSVFAPMISVQIADQFILKHKKTDIKVDAAAGVAWIVGFVIYRILMKYDFVVGYTIPDMLITIMITVGLRKLFHRQKNNQRVLGEA